MATPAGSAFGGKPRYRGGGNVVGTGSKSNPYRVEKGKGSGGGSSSQSQSEEEKKPKQIVEIKGKQYEVIAEIEKPKEDPLANQKAAAAKREAEEKVAVQKQRETSLNVFRKQFTGQPLTEQELYEAERQITAQKTGMIFGAGQSGILTPTELAFSRAVAQKESIRSQAKSEKLQAEGNIVASIASKPRDKITQQDVADVEAYNRKVKNFQSEFRLVDTATQARARLTEQKIRGLESQEKTLAKTEPGSLPAYQLQSNYDKSLKEFRKFTGQPSPPEQNVFGKIANRFGGNVAAAEAGFERTKAGKFYQATMAKGLQGTIDFIEDRQFTKTRSLMVKRDDLIAKRQQVEDGSKEARRLDNAINTLQNKIDKTNFRSNIAIGAIKEVKEKPIQLGVTAVGGLAAGTAFTLVGSGGAVAAGTTKVIGATGLTLYGASTAANIASIKDTTLRQQKIGAVGTELAFFTAGAKAGSGVVQTFGKPVIAKSAYKAETKRVASEKQIVDVSKFQAEFEVKSFFAKPKTVKIQGVGTEKFIKTSENVFVSSGKQAFEVKLPNVKSTLGVKSGTRGISQVDVIGSKSVRLVKSDMFVKGKPVQQTRIIGSRSQVVVKDPLIQTRDVAEVMSIRPGARLSSAKTKGFQTGVSKEYMRTQGTTFGEPITQSVYVSSGIGTESLSFVRFIKGLGKIKPTNLQDFLKSSPKVSPQPGKVSKSGTGKALVQQQKVKTVQQPAVAKADVGFLKGVVKSQLKPVTLKPQPAAAVATIALTKQVFSTQAKSIRQVKPVSTAQMLKEYSMFTQSLRGTTPATVSLIGVTQQSDVTKLTTQKQSQVQLSAQAVKTTPITSGGIKTIPFPGMPPMPIITIPLPPVPVPFALPWGFSGGSGSRRRGRKRRQEKKLTPTLRASVFNLKGRTTRGSIISGLGERFV